MKKVKLCKKPAIKEAFCLIQGKPAVVKDHEAAALTNEAIKFYENKSIALATVPTFIILPVEKEKPENSFWSNQKKWEDSHFNSFISRYGHRYLSIHKLCNDKSKYKSYEESLKPQIIEWIDLYRKSQLRASDSHPIDLISFGYINEFDVDPDSFDITEYLNLNYSVGVDSSLVDSVNNISFNFGLYCSKLDISSTIKVAVFPTGNLSGLKLTVEVYSTFKGVENLSFVDDILGEVNTLKAHAKDTFFSFVTDMVRDDIMGASYVGEEND